MPSVRNRGAFRVMDVDWSEHQRWVSVEGQWINVVEIGSGPPLLLIHGLSCWQSWLENICFFARDHRVIAVDLPGFGASPAPAQEISITGYARTLDALCNLLGVECAAVVGNSMGGFIGAELAIASRPGSSGCVWLRPSA